MWKIALLLSLVALPGCASRQPAPDNETAQAARSASYRVMLVNQTNSTISYNYSRYLPPEAQRSPIVQDPYGSPQMSQSLSLSLSSSELDPGETTILDVLPNSPIRVTYQQGSEKKEIQQSTNQPMQLIVTPEGFKQDALPAMYRVGTGQ